jgi:hypothetical protein
MARGMKPNLITIIGTTGVGKSQVRGIWEETED